MESIFVTPKQNNRYSLGSSEERQFILLLDREQTVNFEVDLAGENARAEIICLVLAGEKQKINLQTTQNHLAKNTMSNLLVKSVLKDEASFSFSGLIKIDSPAQASDAYQHNDNLLLSPNTSCNSRPYLEILANNVRCTHGVTAGQLDTEQLFYLQIRGLHREEATALLIDGFLNALLEKIKDKRSLSLLKTKILSNFYD